MHLSPETLEIIEISQCALPHVRCCAVSKPQPMAEAALAWIEKGTALLITPLWCVIVGPTMKKLMFVFVVLGFVALVYLLDLLAFQYLGLEGHITGTWRLITDVCFALVVVLLILVLPAMRLARKR
jgi:hypothetical protein